MSEESGSVGIDQPRGEVLRERARIRAIQTCPEAKGRVGLANYISLESDLNPEQARKILAASPRDCGVLFHCTQARDEESPIVKVIRASLPDKDVTLMKFTAVVG